MHQPLALLLLLLSFRLGSTEVLSSTSAPLPKGLGNVVKELKSSGASTIISACLVTSIGVTKARRGAVLESLFNVKGEEATTAFGTKGGLVIACPDSSASANDVASVVEACGGTVIFVPSDVDLSREEGLFDTLGPAIERAVSTETKSALIVASDNPQHAKQKFEKAASEALPSIVHGSKSVGTLEDVFTRVEYVHLDADIANLLSEEGQSDLAPDALSLPSQSPMLSNAELATARLLGPKARAAHDAAMSTVAEIVAESTLVVEFGSLCDAAINRALQDLDMKTVSSPLAQKIQAQLKDDLYAELGEVFESQLKELRRVSFDSFKKDLSQLRITPTLATDMESVVQKSIDAFNKASKSLVAKGSKWCTAAAKGLFALQLKEFCSDRLMVAKASGQFRPIPRKGVTVGFHWLLPKPFGNDFRLDPWMLQSAENLIYVPPDKLSEVSPDEVESGDWRDKVIPNPSVRDMVYTQ